MADYDSIPIGSLNDFIVKLDGTELTDVDYSTLKIIYELNSTPSSAVFILARRHDNLDYKLDSVYSQITNENKVEVYDGTYKIFTGYIIEISALSSTDTVQVLAKDARYKFSRTSLNIWYGGKWEEDENNLDTYIKYEKTIGTAIQEVINAVSSFISGYDGVPFQTSFVPEYVEAYNDCASLLNTLIGQTANASWYLDENEQLKYQMIANGTIKSLPLSSLNEHRHVYDVILSDVTLNKQKSGYAKTLNVKLGKHIIRNWARRYYTGWSSGWIQFGNTLKEKISFGFQQWGEVGNKWYIGILGTIYNYVDPDGWVLKSTVVVQYQSKDSDDDLDDITVGSGSPIKTLYLTSYGKKETNTRWEERINPTPTQGLIQPGDGGGFGGSTESSEEVPYLTYIKEESYDYTIFAQDMANFDLNQNNQLQTDAKVTLLLDAYKYYNLKMDNRINLSNTINTTIYKNNNGFPLNINRVLIDCGTRVVTLTLTNYGKSWYVKTANYLSNFIPPSVNYVMRKKPTIKYSSNV